MIKYLSLEQVLKMHDAFIEKFGGLQGIRDMNLLLSAIETPKAAMFGNDLYPTVDNRPLSKLHLLVKPALFGIFNI